jgi:hypothetical protein
MAEAVEVVDEPGEPVTETAEGQESAEV